MTSTKSQKKRSEMDRMMKFESPQEKYVFIIILGMILVTSAIAFYPEAFYAEAEGHTADMPVDMSIGKSIGKSIFGNGVETEIATPGMQNIDMSGSLTPRTLGDYYKMFKCSCCGSSIDNDCCGMATQRKEYVNRLVADGLNEDEIISRMVKQFGFDILMDPSLEQKVRDFMKNSAPENPPKIYLENTRYDFGTISQQDGVVSTTFTVRNTGGSDLIIDNMDTSCMCTSATLTYDGIESPRFGMSMHGENPKDFRLSIPPGDYSELTVYYDPMAHGLQKEPEMKIMREVTIVSNDPVDFQKKVRIELTQTK